MKQLMCLIVISLAVTGEASQTPAAPSAFTPADEAAIMRVVIRW